jgi:hypothetical protein
MDGYGDFYAFSRHRNHPVEAGALIALEVLRNEYSEHLGETF